MSLGYTIESLQQDMSWREYLTWCAYREKYGPLSPVRKYDQGSAIVASQINRSVGGKGKPIDFMPYSPGEEDVEVSQEDFFKMLGGENGK